ncbi:GAF domain-containing protein [Mucilaginibacter sp.]|uniref:GAF domain-containing protein n=1 Tax=Mucilaginibacter sp. TaxID=1882438 RepID=UPI003D0DA266
MDYEIKRLEAVNRFKHLEDNITKELNDIVRLAAQICNTPVGLVTLLDEDTQWFKASFGIDITTTSREVAFCNHTIKQDKILIITDTENDERSKDNPLVYGDTNIKFYAGSKLATNDGFAIGSLCVIDFEPKTLNEQQQNALTILSKQVINLMELHWSLQSLAKQHQTTHEQKISIQESEIKLKAIFDSSKDTHILVDRKLQILAFNKSAAVFISALFRKILTNGDNILDYTEPQLHKQFTKYLSLALSGRSAKREWIMMAGTAHECWKETSFIPVKNNNGEVLGVALNSTDITTRKRHEKLISIQNEALTRIAIIQSHELRRPVASLLGIIDLMKIDAIDFGYFNILEVTVNELDQKIRGIVKDSEDTIQGSHLSIVA